MKQDSTKKAIRAFLLILIGLFIAFILWASISQLEISSTAAGVVSPISQVKEIQHLEGGIVKDIKVYEGNHVKKGQPLIVLEGVGNKSDVQQLIINIASLKVKIARLEAELAGFRNPKYPKEIVKQDPKLIEEANKLFAIHKQQYQSELETRQKQIAQQQYEYNATKERLANLQGELKLLQEQISISNELLEDDLTNRYNHIELLRSEKSLKGKIIEERIDLKRLNEATAEKRIELIKTKQKYRAEASEKLETTRLRFDELTKKLAKYQDSLQRTTLVSPVDGIVRQLHVSTAGGVIKPGQTVMDIVPSSDKLIIEARLSVRDIGYIKLGQTAVIRLASNEGRRFSAIKGTVAFISPDTLINEEDKPYYKVKITTTQDHFEYNNIKYKLYPGMQVSVNIVTGHRSVLSYLLTPFLGWTNDIFRER